MSKVLISAAIGEPKDNIRHKLLKAMLEYHEIRYREGIGVDDAGIRESVLMAEVATTDYNKRLVVLELAKKFGQEYVLYITDTSHVWKRFTGERSKPSVQLGDWVGLPMSTFPSINVAASKLPNHPHTIIFGDCIYIIRTPEMQLDDERAEKIGSVSGAGGRIEEDAHKARTYPY